jgi:hypothetical protein
MLATIVTAHSQPNEPSRHAILGMIVHHDRMGIDGRTYQASPVRQDEHSQALPGWVSTERCSAAEARSFHVSPRNCTNEVTRRITWTLTRDKNGAVHAHPS